MEITKTTREEYLLYVEQALLASNLYYNDPGNSTLPDHEYDALVDKIAQYEVDHPDEVVGVSPTQVVGAPVSADAVPHPVPMLSLRKIKTKEEAEAFIRSLPSTAFVVAQSKIDGVSMSLEYENGKLVRAMTRGDGRVGEDVTDKLSLLSSVPTWLYQTDFTGIVRGECVIHVDELNPRFKNARNGVAGVINSSRVEDARDEHVRFYAFDLLGQQLPTRPIETLREFGFTPAPTSRVAGVQDVWNVIQLTLALETPFLTDGVVLKIANTDERAKMGSTSNAPRGAVAFKGGDSTVETTLTGVSFQVGKSGALGIVGLLEPVEHGGVSIARATLHNPSIVRQLDLRIGDVVEVTRANGVIPRIERVARGGSLRTGEERLIEFPANCPSCAEVLEETGNSGILKCTGDECFPQLVRRLVHWSSRKAADIDSISTTWIETFVEGGLMGTVADFYKLSRRDLMYFENMGDGRATKFLESIEKSKGVGMRKALVGLSIPSASEGTAERLAKEFDSVEQVASASLSELAAVPDVGIVVASSIHAFFQSGATQALLRDLRALGVNLDRLVVDAPLVLSDASGEFAGKICVITGKLSIERDEMKKLLEAAGAKVTGSVSKRSDFLIIGESVGKNKTDKAREVGTTVITEETARTMLGL